eukprot:TRINITY_DN3524_c0_g1_i1.p1 TRINITY_DN3524_c0_g1~~TRINITY_DN3524_c0_g1_i1.p1  ORF type:complete len:446 (+),score=76.35 TRINITY_DN3524_c0_g1_i1:139-1476(+)
MLELLYTVADASTNTTATPELFSLEIIPATIIALLAASLCSGVGIGGGAFYIATFILIVPGATVHFAVPLSKMTILGTAIGGLFVNFTRRHPNADVPLIDYEASLLMEPCTLIGTIIGVILNVTFPAYIILVCLILLLSFTTYKTYQSGMNAYRKDKADAAKASSVVNRIENRPLLDESEAESAADEIVEEPEFRSDERNPELKKIRDEGKRLCPPMTVFLMVIIWVAFIAYTIVSDSSDGTSKAGVKCGSLAWALILAGTVIGLFAVTVFLCKRMMKQHRRKVENGYNFAEGEIKWGRRKTLTMAFSSIVAGTAAAFLGIGGGMVQGPLMIQFKFLPAVSAATAAFMILYTASSSSAQYMVLGRLSPDWGGYFLVVGLLGAVVGHIGVGWLVKKYKKPYIITFLLAFLIFVSMLAFVALAIYQIVESSETFTFKSPCSVYSASG